MVLRRSSAIIVGTCCLGLLAAVFGAATEAASARSDVHATANATVISVIAGKPSELAFKLSKFSALPVGTLTFSVKNEGAAAHDFKLCSTPVGTDAHNTCVGVTTKILKPGQSATLTIKITKKGTYEYLCTEPGHAAAGMKGIVGVGVVVKAPKLTSTTTTKSGGTGCPKGETIAQVSPIGDNDADNSPGGSDDHDGCL
jgi:uncharacterized cupredoxin-like copper-binding protein